jgi:hypothetical protein
MLWFRHAHDLRNSPAMKQIQRRCGDEGFAAAIRLIEVLTYRAGSGSKFSPVLTLKPPTSFQWLAQEICTPADETDDCADKLTDFLNEFSLAGLTVCNPVEDTEQVFSKEKGEWERRPVTYWSVQLLEFEEFMDVWTKRVHDGKPGANSTKV